jgi:histidinol phosphatase-like PHP family hydrolase
MIDLHTHTLFSDGELVPAELVRRAACIGYRYIAITDHADSSNLETAVTGAVKAAEEARRHGTIVVIPGVELTHIHPDLIPELIREARWMGARLVVVHGETMVEPVAKGTNSAAVKGGADIISHPGLITAAVSRRAARKRVHLEITARKGHCLANGHVARVARETGAPLVVGTDSHGPGDLTSRADAERVARGAGLSPAEIRRTFGNAERLAVKLTL